MTTEKCKWLCDHFEQCEIKAREEAAKLLAKAEKCRMLKEKYRPTDDWHDWCNPLARA